MPRTETEKQFLYRYVEYLNRILNTTVTDSHLVLVDGPNEERWVVTRFQAGAIKPLALRPRGFLFFRQLIRREIDPDPEVEDHVIVEEAVYVYSPTDNEDADWVFRYEYNNPPREGVPHSHLHVNGVHRNDPAVDFEKLHLPAGRLSIEQILAYLIQEHGVEAKPEAGDDVMRILAETHRGFMRRRTDLDDPLFP